MVDVLRGRCISPRMFSNWILISMFFRSQTVWSDRHRRAVWQTRLLEAMSPWLGGGKMVHEVSLTVSRLNLRRGNWKQERQMSWRHRIKRGAGMADRLRYQPGESWSRSLATLAEEALAKRPAFVHSAARIPACWPLILLEFSQRYGDTAGGVRYCPARRAACAQPLLAELGVTGTLRASFGHIIQRVMWMRW